MARVVPQRERGEFKSAAEWTLYREFVTQLSDDYVVLHSVAWRSRIDGRDRDGEADFVIAHPRHGVLVLEVKGGTISREIATDAWNSRDGKGIDHPIKNPFQQANDSMYLLRDSLQAGVATSGYSYRMGRAVVFPDVIVGENPFGPDAPRELVIDSSDLATLARGLHRAWGSSNQPGPGDAGVTALVKALRPPVALNRLGLVGAMRREADELVQLTKQQTILLESCRRYRRLAFSGCAGSGKTMLAIEQVRQNAREGRRVLFTCFNRALGDMVEATLRRELPEAMDRIVVENYHDLAERVVWEAGIPLSLPADPAEQARYYDDLLPEAFLQAIETTRLRFDAIVVDEGQDFADIWWVTLEALFTSPAESIFTIFYDEHQRIFDKKGTIPIPEPHQMLTRNCRNTRAIHAAAITYSENDGGFSCDGPAGRAPVEVPTTVGEEIATLKRELHLLLETEGVPLEEIVLLTPRSVRSSCFTEGAKLGNVSLTWEEPGPGKLCCRSIASYKGLESNVVILAETDRFLTGKEMVLTHVALTRGKHHVIVLGSLPKPDIQP